MKFLPIDFGADCICQGHRYVERNIFISFCGKPVWIEIYTFTADDLGQITS